MAFGAILGTVLKALGTGAKAIGTGAKAVGAKAATAAKSMQTIGNSIGKGMTTASKYIGDTANNLVPLTQVVSGYSGYPDTLGQYPRMSSYNYPMNFSQNTLPAQSGTQQNQYSSSAIARRLRGLF